jgi:hypothetical protein
MDGKKNVVAGSNAGYQNNGGFIVLDDACDPFAIYADDFNKIYTNQFNSIFMRDTYTGTATTAQLRNIRLRGFYGEPQTNTTDYAVQFQAMCANCTMEGQWYASYGLGGQIPWNFGLGFINGMTDIDSSGQSFAPAGEFTATTCTGSYLNLGTQDPALVGCNDAVYTNGTAGNAGEAMQGLTASHFAGGGGIYAPTPGITGGTLNPGSTDSVGMALSSAGSASVTLTFATPFRGTQVACVTTDDGQLNMWVPENKTNQGVTFDCFSPAGVACTGNNWLVYHCFGVGGP